MYGGTPTGSSTGIFPGTQQINNFTPPPPVEEAPPYNPPPVNQVPPSQPVQPAPPAQPSKPAQPNPYSGAANKTYKKDANYFKVVGKAKANA